MADGTIVPSWLMTEMDGLSSFSPQTLVSVAAPIAHESCRSFPYTLKEFPYGPGPYVPTFFFPLSRTTLSRQQIRKRERTR
jgi:hypothetical protein